MSFLVDRYINANHSIDYMDYLLTNLLNNKSTLLSREDFWEVNNLEFNEELSRIHQNMSSKTDVFYDFSINTMEVTQHRAPVFNKTNLIYNSSEVYAESIRNITNVNMEYITSNIFDNKYGIITNIYKDIHSKEYCVVGAEISPIPNKRVEETGFGRSSNFKDATKEAVLESLERICMFQFENEKGRMRLEDAIKGSGFEKDIKTRDKFDSEISTVVARELKTGEEINLPLQFFSYANEDDFQIVNETSNGMALGTTPKEALIYGLLELIERDAFLTFWHKQVKLKKIAISSLGVPIQNIINEFINDEIQIHLFDMSFDINIPVILCLILSESIKPCTYVSSAAHIHYETAVKGAIKEAIVAHAIYRNNDKVGKEYKSKDEVLELTDHYNYYSRKEKISTYDFLIKDNPEVHLAELYPKVHLENDQQVLDYIIRKLRSIEKIFYLDYSHPILEKCNLSVAKVISPNMQTMYFGVGNERINQARIDSAVNNSKYKSSALIPEGEYYNEPHPFP